MSANTAYESLGSDNELQPRPYGSSKAENRQSFLRTILRDRDGERSRWLPYVAEMTTSNILTEHRWLSLAFAVCFFFFLSMVYSVRAIDRYDADRRSFLIISWSIFLVPSITVAFFVLTPFPLALRAWRHRQSQRKPRQCKLAFEASTN